MVGQRLTRPIRHTIFLEDYIDVPMHLAAIEQRFLAGGGWLAPFANSAEHEGEALLMRLGPAWGGGRIAREVRVRIRGTRTRGEANVISLTWVDAQRPGLFPVLDGDLELAPVGDESCRLTLSATYTPPLGDFGADLDRAVLHHVAQSTVRSFLCQVAKTLES
ncbi:MAG: hypothetical protein WCF24_03135 [Acidimicrobiales bacterium]